MQINLPFVHPQKRKKSIKIYSPKVKKIVKIHKVKKVHLPYTYTEIQNMTDSQLDYLYEHGSPAERDIAGEVIQNRKNWDTIINKGLDDPLPRGSGQSGAPEAPTAGSSKV